MIRRPPRSTLFPYTMLCRSVQFGIVEEVALNAPNLVVLLLPLRPRIDLHLHARQVERRLRFACRGAFAFRGSGGGADKPLLVLAPTLAVEHLLSVERKSEVVRAFHQLFRLARRQIKSPQRALLVRTRTRWLLHQEYRSRFSCQKLPVVARGDRQRQN